MQRDSNRLAARDLCLEARITAADPELVRRSVERWLREAGVPGHDGAAFHAQSASFYLESGANGRLSVILHAWGEGAGRILAWHGSDLVGAVARSRTQADLTWIRRPCTGALAPVPAPVPAPAHGR